MIRKFLTHVKEAFDLGANVGVWTVLMNKANPQARARSFEPNPATHELIERNIKENQCSNVLL
jgi:FkbM family methyltransferase